MIKKKILVIDDNELVVKMISDILVCENYDVVVAGSGEEGLKKVEEERPDLVLLDVVLPKMNGFEVCKILREDESNNLMPIIMLTGQDREEDILNGLDLGADDYITKPFSPRELMARVKANLRRHSSGGESGSRNIIKCGSLEINLESYEVKRDGEVIDLTLREFELVKFLAQHQGQVFSREALLEKVWGYEYYGDVRTVDVTVRRVREKIERKSNDNNYEYLLTKRGVGYYFNKF